MTGPRSDAAGASGASLSLRAVSKRYADQVAVDRVSLDIHGGEFVTLLGPSGSGKTTTLNMIAGFVQADEGEILLDGTSIAGLPPHKRNIGMVFQNYALFPHMNAFDNVGFPLQQRRVPKRERNQRVREALDLVQMGRFADRQPRELSGGQQQRIAVARAIVFNPRVLLMDEPLGALDKKLREALQMEIKRIHRELGITFIYVTHDQEEALSMSDRIAVFNEGAVAQIGAAAELYYAPASAFVANFVGESNLFAGHVAFENGLPCLESGELVLRLGGGDNHRAGEEVTLVVRPEHISVLHQQGAPAEGANLLQGRLEDVTFLGNASKYVVKVDGCHALVSARVNHASIVRPPALGDRVWLTWPAAAGIVVG
jgi:putative spermidine/putrescine transport system ATP-binding protein